MAVMTDLPRLLLSFVKATEEPEGGSRTTIAE
jgi:hypothetical protein